MRADTQAISIQASPDVVVDFLGDPRNLPRWAVGFAKSVRQDGARWIVSTARGEVPIRIVSDRRFGVVDFHMNGGDIASHRRRELDCLLRRGRAPTQECGEQEGHAPRA